MAVAVGDPVILARAPGYQVAQTAVTSDSSAITTTETVVISVTASLISGVQYWVDVDIGVQSSVATDVAFVRLREDSLTGTERQFAQAYIDETSSTVAVRERLRYQYTAGSTGSKTFVATVVRLAGTGDLRLEASGNRPSYLTVTVAA